MQPRQTCKRSNWRHAKEQARISGARDAKPHKTETKRPVSIRLIHSTKTEFTSIRAARKFVARGLADWVNDHTIKFRSEAERKAIQHAQERQSRATQDAAAGVTSDKAVHSDIASLKQLRGVPIQMPHRMLIKRNRGSAT